MSQAALKCAFRLLKVGDDMMAYLKSRCNSHNQQTYSGSRHVILFAGVSAAVVAGADHSASTLLLHSHRGRPSPHAPKPLKTKDAPASTHSDRTWECTRGAT